MADFIVGVWRSYAKIKQNGVIMEGATNVTVSFEFSPEWDGVAKTAVFTDGLKTKVIPNIGEEVTIPWEVCFNPTRRVRVGIYGMSGQREVITTVWADLATVTKAVDGDADESTDPTLPIWQVLTAQVADRYTKAEADERFEKVIDANEVRSRLTAVETELPNKSNVGHTHDVADVEDLNNILTNKSDAGHNHDDAYYTKAEIDQKLSRYMPLIR